MNSFNSCRSSIVPPTSLGTYLTQYDLVEAWRWKHADGKEYSCKSDSHGTLSHIDLGLLSPDLLSMVSDVRYLPRAVPDHSLPCWYTWLWEYHPLFGWWLSPLWLADQAVTDRGTADIRSHWATNAQSASNPVVWEAFKATMRGSFAAAIGQAGGCGGGASSGGGGLFRIPYIR